MTITDYISRAARQLEGAGLEDPRREARMLLLEGAGLALAEQYAHPGRELSPDLEERLLAALERRSSREPLSSIFTSAFFCGHRFALNADCLAPRPETELLVETALELLKSRLPLQSRSESGSESKAESNSASRPALSSASRQECSASSSEKISASRPALSSDLSSDACLAAEPRLELAELCCGSAAPGLSLLWELEQLQKGSASLFLGDLSGGAIYVAMKNAAALGLDKSCRFALCDLFPPEKEETLFDLILVNPPYIPRAEISGLMPEVRDYEPHLALDGGEDGLDFYRRLAASAAACLKEGGWLLMEHGAAQEADIREIFADWVQSRGSAVISRGDAAGHDRVLAFQVSGRKDNALS